MKWSKLVAKVASDPRAQQMIRQTATQLGQKAQDPATRAKINNIIANIQKKK